MKIILAHNYYQQRGGEDNVFEAETTLLREKGHDVETLVFNNEKIKSCSDKISTGFSGFYNIDTAKSMKKTVESFKPDILHVHNFFPLASPSLFYTANKYNIPVVMTLHNYRLICANGLLFRDGKTCEDCIDKALPVNGILHNCYRGSKIETMALSGMTTLHRHLGTWHTKVDHYIALTEFARTKFVHSSLNLPENKISVKPNFIENPGYSPSDARKDFMLFVGRLTSEKGVLVLLEAFKTLDVPLKIIGTGPLEKQVQQACDEYSHLEYLGFCDRDFILEQMKQCRALVFPSIWYEGFPVTLLESLSTGTPVVCSRIGGLPEIIENNYSGLLFEPGSIEDLQEKAKAMITIPLYGELCQNARDTFINRYTADQNYEQLISIYNKLTN